MRGDRLGRAVLLGLEGFVAATAVGGGLLLVLEIDRFPAEWLADSPFTDYRLPGLILTVVGFVFAAAFVAAWRRSTRAGIASLAAAVVLVGFLAGEVAFLERNGAAQDPRSPTEGVYGLIAIVIAAISLSQWSRARGGPAA